MTKFVPYHSTDTSGWVEYTPHLDIRLLYTDGLIKWINEHSTGRWTNIPGNKLLFEDAGDAMLFELTHTPESDS